MLLAEGISKCTQIEEATFKVIQYVREIFLFSTNFIRPPEISGECYLRAAELISKLDNLKKIDIYFRR